MFATKFIGEKVGFVFRGTTVVGVVERAFMAQKHFVLEDGTTKTVDAIRLTLSGGATYLLQESEIHTVLMGD